MCRMFVSAALLIMTSGCGAEYWTGKTTMRTELRGPGFSFIDTKDNSIDLGKAEYDPQTNHFVIQDLKVVNNASKPITAEIDRIRAIGDAQMSQVIYVQTLLSGMSSLLERMTPVLGQAASVLGAMNPPAQRSVGVPTPWGQVNIGQSTTPLPATSQPAYPAPTPLPAPVVWTPQPPTSQPALQADPEPAFALPFGAGQ